MITDLLDIRTLSFVTVLFCGNFGLGLLIYGRLQNRFRGVSWFGIGVIVSSIGFLLIALRRYVPDFLSIILANGLILAGLTMAYVGLRKFSTNRSVSIAYFIVLFASYICLFVYFTYIQPSLTGRVVVISAQIAVMSFFCGWTILDGRAVGKVGYRLGTAIPFFANATYNLIRIVLTLVGEPANDFFAPSAVQGLAFIIWTFQILLSSFGLLWMASAILEAELREQARIDPLTQLLNRRALEEIAYREVSRARRGSYELSVAMIDVDRFKQLNDTLGHQAGDTVLASIAGLLSVGLRTQDVVARYGGEEFIVVLPDTDYHSAFSLTDRIRSEIAEFAVNTEAGPATVTASAGVASFRGSEDEWEDIVGRADDALYRAKEGGRNLVK